MEVVLCR